MLHHCMEGERVGVDGSEVVGVDPHHDPYLERGREPPSFFFFLDLPPRWEEGFPSGPCPPWRQRGGSPSEIGCISLFLFCFVFLLSGLSPFLKYPEIHNSDWVENLT